MSDNLDPIYGGPGIHKTRKANPYDVLRRIKDKTGLPWKATLKPFTSEVLSDPELMDAVIEYFHINAIRSFEGISNRRAKASLTPEERAKREQEVNEAVSKVKAKLILDYLMPNGKQLKDCTFGYLRQIGGKFTNLGKAGKPSQVVGKTLDAKQVQDLWRNG